jgi:hypothetical protein
MTTFRFKRGFDVYKILAIAGIFYLYNLRHIFVATGVVLPGQGDVPVSKSRARQSMWE